MKIPRTMPSPIYGGDDNRIIGNGGDGGDDNNRIIFSEKLPIRQWHLACGWGGMGRNLFRITRKVDFNLSLSGKIYMFLLTYTSHWHKILYEKKIWISSIDSNFIQGGPRFLSQPNPPVPQRNPRPSSKNCPKHKTPILPIPEDTKHKTQIVHIPPWPATTREARACVPVASLTPRYCLIIFLTSQYLQNESNSTSQSNAQVHSQIQWHSPARQCHRPSEAAAHQGEDRAEEGQGEPGQQCHRRPNQSQTNSCNPPLLQILNSPSQMHQDQPSNPEIFYGRRPPYQTDVWPRVG